MKYTDVYLMIAIPVYADMCTDFVLSLIKLIQKLVELGIRYEVQVERATLIYASRDKLAKKAIAGTYTHILWLDADMVFEPDDFLTLLNTDMPFVTGAYCSRHTGRYMLFSSIRPEPVLLDSLPEELTQIVASGFGFVLITREALSEVMDIYASCFFPILGFGEDLSFCERASFTGIDLYVHPGVRLGHIGTKVY